MSRSDRYPVVLLGAFVVIWLVLAINPWYRQDWLLENMLVVVAVPTLVFTARSLRFSNFAYTCLFVFFTLHCVGAHFTYSEVPWREWLGLATTGRNHYDRFVHFAYGLLLFPASWELFEARSRPQRIWRYLFPLFFLIAHSVIYELIEWAAATVFGGDLGQAYLGTQGDIWDAQKDMALAGMGAIVGLAVTTAVVHLRSTRSEAG